MNSKMERVIILMNYLPFFLFCLNFNLSIRNRMTSNDDFFGLERLQTISLPERYRQPIKPNSNSDENIFDAQFFPDLIESSETKKKEEDQGSFIEDQFFQRNHSSADGEHQIERKMETLSLEDSALSIDESSFDPNGLLKSGIKRLWDMIDPVWTFKADELADYMAQRVIYETDDFLALDKPFQMACTSGPVDQAQLDRILRRLKEKIAPSIDRLYLINTLDKNCSGVVLLAKSKEKCEELKKELAEGNFLFHFRCLCKNIPQNVKSRINIPLIKVMKGSNIKFCPLIGSTKKQIYHVVTDCKLVNQEESAYVSLVDAFSKGGMSQFVRSHLYYGLNCPVIGDKKYVKAHLKHKNILETAISKRSMELLNLRKNDIRKLPMFMHLAEVHVPRADSNGDFTLIRAEMPRYFVYALKKLFLFRK